VADLVIRCGEGDVPLALKLALDLVVQLLLEELMATPRAGE
jgi:hypothetical protein